VCVVKLYLSRFLFFYFCVLVLMLEIVVRYSELPNFGSAEDQTFRFSVLPNFGATEFWTTKDPLCMHAFVLCV